MTTDPRMSSDTHQLIERVEMAERSQRGWRAVSFIALVAAAFALAQPFPRPAAGPAPADRNGRFSVVDAHRVLLRDRSGAVAGGLDVDDRGTIRLVLGRSGSAAAFLEVQQDGVAHLRLRAADGTVRAAVVGGDQPMLALSPDGRRSSIQLGTTPAGGGTMQASDGAGRVRFRAP